MAASTFKGTQLYADEFVISCGSVLVRESQSKLGAFDICILRYAPKDEWLLPKGRKDCNESLTSAAVRETFEETGYPCEIMPLDLMTRAPPPGSSGPDKVNLIIDATEPIALTIRHLGDKNSKLIWWFVTRLKAGATKMKDTQMQNEDFESVFLEAEEAIEKLTFENDRDIARKALECVKASGSYQIAK